MKEKKTAVITFRTEQWTKEALERIANTNKWSVAQTVNELCKKYAINPRPEEIIILHKSVLNRKLEGPVRMAIFTFVKTASAPGARSCLRILKVAKYVTRESRQPRNGKPA